MAEEQEQLNRKGFIRNPNILEETYQQEKDLLKFDAIIADFKNFLDNIDKSAIVGLIGRFGVGKSTMLYQLRKKDEADKSKKVKWVQFDAWKYPDKKDLWEGFIFDFIQSTNPEKWKEVRKKIDGEEVSGIRALISLLGTRFGVLLKDPMIVPAVVGKLGVLFRSSPIKRLNEYQELLGKYIRKHLGDFETIYIVVEDIDRSQDGGIFFLETLNYFLKTYGPKLGKKIIVIAPMNAEYLGQHNPPGNESGSNEQVDEYLLKSLDYTIKFNPANIDFSDFIREIIDLDKIEGECEIILSHFQYLLREATKKMSIRKIKLLMREANNRYLSLLNDEERRKVDIRVWLAFYFAKYLAPDEIVFEDPAYHQQIIKNAAAPWLYRLLVAIAERIRSEEHNSELNSFTAKKVQIRLVDDSEAEVRLAVPKYEESHLESPGRGIERRPYYSLSNIYIEKLEMD